MTAETFTPQEIQAAVDSLVHTYNQSRSAHLGYAYASPSLLASDEHLKDAVAALMAGYRFELERLTAHSVTLNSVSFAMAQALGDVPPGADSVEGNPVEQVARLIGTLERRTAQLDEARAEIDRLRDISEPAGVTS